MVVFVISPVRLYKHANLNFFFSSFWSRICDISIFNYSFS